MILQLNAPNVLKCLFRNNLCAVFNFSVLSMTMYTPIILLIYSIYMVSCLAANLHVIFVITRQLILNDYIE